MKWLFRFTSKRALAKGSSRFAALSIAIGVLRALRSLLHVGPRTLHRFELEPGEVLIVREKKHQA